jgi:demethoxyubiquinone hydroxylase (CLK1/Coq7/Cat5 family)
LSIEKPREAMLEKSYHVQLVEILQLAYSGERAAAYAYRGHWHSVSSPEERQRIQKIENEEWHHRRIVGEMLSTLGAAPDPWREIRASIIGRTLQALCHVSGWLLPMYGAGKLERRNIVEYEHAAQYALGSHRQEFIDCLLTMAEVEWEHEQYFRAKVLSHRLGRLLPIWPAPPPKESIRSSFQVA